MHADMFIKAMAALAQEHRLAAFRQLVQAGPGGVAAGALAARLDLPPSSLSFHLGQLSHAGLVGQRRQGRSILYFAIYPAMTALLAYLTENCCAGASCASETVPACKPADEQRNVA